MADLAPQSFLQRLVAHQIGRTPLIRPHPRVRFEMVDIAEDSLTTAAMVQNPPALPRMVDRPIPAATQQASLPEPSPELFYDGPAADSTLDTPPPAIRQPADPTASDHGHVLARSRRDPPQLVVTKSEPKPVEQVQHRRFAEPSPASELAGIMSEPKLVEQLQPESNAEPPPTLEPAGIMSEAKLAERLQPEPTAVVSPPAGPIPSVMPQPAARLVEPRGQAPVQFAAARAVVSDVAQPATVHVSIGRVEIKAVPVFPNSRSATRKRPLVQSLDEYLDARREG